MKTLMKLHINENSRGKYVNTTQTQKEKLITQAWAELWQAQYKFWLFSSGCLDLILSLAPRPFLGGHHLSMSFCGYTSIIRPILL